MATFTTCIRNKRNDGYYPVYIRVAHKNNRQYINTGLVVNEKGLRTIYDEKGKRITEIKDRFVLSQCGVIIESYITKMNRSHAGEMECKELIDYLKESGEEISFTEYAKKFIDDMINEGRDNHARNYKLAVTRLTEHVGRDNIKFNELTSNVIESWIYSMRNSARKKSLYPTCVRAIFNSAIKVYNDYDYDIIRIRTNPFSRVKIPKEEVPEKRYVASSIIRKVLMSDITLPDYDGISRKEMSQDVGKLIFCLAGINTADLYDLKQSSLQGWKLCYNRKKLAIKAIEGLIWK